MAGNYTFGDILLFALYGATSMLALTASLYLLLRRSNAIVPGITPPLRLRRWAAAFFGSSAAALVWWLLIYYAPPPPPIVILSTVSCSAQPLIP